MFVQLIEEGKTPSDGVTKQNLDAWIISVKVPYTTLMGAASAGDPFALKTALGAKETIYIVERATRKILAKQVANMTGALDKLAALP